MSILIFVLILLVVVLVHEWGHFFSAKKFGIRVDEFGFGFPPKLFGYKKGETEYTFNLLPIGGFVKIFGENPDEESLAGPDSDRSFVNKPRWKQAIVLFAGVFMNFILAWVLFSFGFMSGIPTSVGSVPESFKLTDVNLMVISVLKDSPAEVAGLLPGDKITKLESSEDALLDVNPDSLKSFVASHPADNIDVTYKRGKENTEYTSSITPYDNNGVPMIGISMDEVGVAKLPFFAGVAQGLELSVEVTKGTVSGLFNLLKDSISGRGSLEAVTGPVGMVGIVGNAYEFGFAYLLSFAALISINLAVINLVPFPALDGGRLLFLLIEKIKGSRLNPKFANTANMIGFGLLIVLMLVITYHDIVKLL